MAHARLRKNFLTSENSASIQQLFVTTAAGLVTIIGLRFIAQDLIAPVLMAFFLSILMLPLFRWFRKRGFSRHTSLIGMLATFLIGVILFGLFLTWALSLIRESMQTYLETADTAFTQFLAANAIDTQTTTQMTQSVSPESLSKFISTLFQSIGNVIFYLIIIPILAVMLLLQFDAFSEDPNAKSLINSPRIKRYKKFADSIIIYIIGRFKVNLVTGILLTVLLFILGIDFALIWGVLTIFLSFIPYVGLIIAGTGPTLLAFTQHGLPMAVLVVGGILLINFFAENVLDPVVQGSSNKLSTATIVIALIFWTWIFGGLGTILSVPLTVLLKTILADYRETQWLASIMEGSYEAPKSNQSFSNFFGYITSFVKRKPENKK